ncbi:MAG TPA: hypothetical protein VNT23_09625 [Gaiellaceae bacterium]|nr:hypothetical protein [Gaiellaceae bacterium]
MGVRLTLVAALAALAAAPSAVAGGWLPASADAEWVYEFNNTAYSAVPVKEKVTVRSATGRSFILNWTTEGQGNPENAHSSVGTVSFQDTASGLINTDWASSVPPPDFPILCARAGNCGNSLASSFYLLIWGNRAPLLVEPLLRGSSWASTGGVEGDVTSLSTYVGRERVQVPAFPSPVLAAKVRTEVTQAGALGDPFGSGVRTVWWVYGVGPVKIVLEHAGGADAPTSTSTLQSTNRIAQAPPPDANYFPLRKGLKTRYAWRNTKHLKQRSVQEFNVDETANNSARVSVKHVSGPIRVAGTYGFALRTDGLTNIWGATQAASLAKFPALGPRALAPDKRRRFFTPYDLMTYGSNPVLPAYPKARESWTVKRPSRDFSIFGARGKTTVLGLRTVRVPAGRFRALAVQSTFTQAGFPFGSGTRTSYFAANRGLVKLVFRHRDGSVSTVELLR